MKEFRKRYTTLGDWLDNETDTRLAELPVVRDCGVVGYLDNPCDGYNYHLCGIDRPFSQPVCIGNKSILQCDIPDGKVSYIVTIDITGRIPDNASVGFIIKDIANTWDCRENSANLNRKEITLDAGMSVITDWVDISRRFGYIDSFYLRKISNEWILQEVTGTGPKLIKKLSNNTFQILLDQDYIEKYYGTDLCNETLEFCDISHVDGVSVNALTGSIMQQPQCCAKKDYSACSIPVGYVEYRIRARVNGRGNMYGILSTTNNAFVFEIDFQGVTDQADFTTRLLAASRAPGTIFLTTSVPDEYIIRISITALMLSHEFAADFCDIPLFSLPTDNILFSLEVIEQGVCCGELLGNNLCNSIPRDYAYTTFTIKDMPYYKYGSELGTNDRACLVLSNPLLLDTNNEQVSKRYANDPGFIAANKCSSTTGNPITRLFTIDFKTGDPSSQSPLADIAMDFVVRLNGYLESNNLGFARAINNKIEIYTKKNISGACNPFWQINQATNLYPDSSVANKFKIEIESVVDYVNISNLHGNESLILNSICCDTPGAGSTPDCCECSEQFLCILAGKVTAAMQSYIADNRQPPQGGTMNIVNAISIKGFSDLAGMIKSPENDCWSLDFSWNWYEILQNASQQRPYFVMQIRLIPKVACNRSYVSALFIDIMADAPVLMVNIYRSKEYGIIYPNEAFLLANGPNNERIIVPPSNYELAPATCEPDPLCSNNLPTFINCKACDTKLDCEETDGIFLQFQMPDYCNDWENGGLYGWVDRIPVAGGVFCGGYSAPWLCYIEGISVDKTNGSITKYNSSTFVKKSFVGKGENGNFIQQLLIDPTNLSDEFYFKIIFNLGGDTSTIYTEPYTKTRCDENFLIEGLYNNTGKYTKDCEGNTYELAAVTLGSPPFIFSNKVRVKGTFDFIGFDVESEIVKNRTVATENKEKYRLRTEPIPLHYATKLKICLQAGVILINGEEYTFNGGVEKGNDEGTMWIFDVELTKILEENCRRKNFLCN